MDFLFYLKYHNLNTYSNKSAMIIFIHKKYIAYLSRPSGRAFRIVPVAAAILARYVLWFSTVLAHVDS